MDARSQQLHELQRKGYASHAKASDGVEEIAIPKRKSGDPPVAYYDSTHKSYWMMNSRDRWVEYSETSVKRFLKFRVYDKLSKDEGKEFMIEQHLIELQTKLDVAHVGELAGYTQGMKSVCGERFLVTNGCVPVKRKAGKWNTLDAFSRFCSARKCYGFITGARPQWNRSQTVLPFGLVSSLRWRGRPVAARVFASISSRSYSADARHILTRS